MTGQIHTTRWQTSRSGERSSEMAAPTYISQDSESEHPTKVATRKHRIDTHFPQNRNCQICKRINITWAPCRRRTGEALPRAEKLGDLITADYKVLNEGGESRDNHWYAVVIQDLATQRIQSNPCNTKTSQESEKRFLKFLEPSQAPKVEKTDISMEFGKSWEDLSWTGMVV